MTRTAGETRKAWYVRPILLIDNLTSGKRQRAALRRVGMAVSPTPEVARSQSVQDHGAAAKATPPRDPVRHAWPVDEALATRPLLSAQGMEEGERSAC
jgi:hypothetical protein